MTTIADAMDAATAELRLARVSFDAATAALQNKGAQAQTIITNYVNRPVTTSFFVDPIEGSDNNDGLTLETPLRSIDTALERLPRDGYSGIYLLGDATIKNYRNLYSPLTIAGIQRGNGQAGSMFSFALRRLNFQSEASNSPVLGLGRAVAGFNIVGAYIRYMYIDVMAGDPVSAIDVKYHHQLQGTDLQMSACNFNAPRPESLASLVSPADGAHSGFYFTGSLGANAPGHIVAGKSAGSNPNTQYNFTTNLGTA